MKLLMDFNNYGFIRWERLQPLLGLVSAADMHTKKTIRTQESQHFWKVRKGMKLLVFQGWVLLLFEPEESTCQSLIIY